MSHQGGTNSVILTWNNCLTPATLHIWDTLRPHPAMGLKPLGENAAVTKRGQRVDKWCNVVESPFSNCAQHRAYHALVHLVVPQHPYGLLPVEALQFKRET